MCLHYADSVKAYKLHYTVGDIVYLSLLTTYPSHSFTCAPESGLFLATEETHKRLYCRVIQV